MSLEIGYETLLDSPVDLADKFERNLIQACHDEQTLIRFKNSIQLKNLSSLLKEAYRRIDKYEQIYPYIKELCHNQIINPLWYQQLEDVLNFALKKGRGKRDELPADTKDAWLTYIVLLSCSMIDSNEQTQNQKKRPKLKDELNKLFGFTGKN